jgi:hypothetical protein
MAKSQEDTAFFRFTRCLAHCEVGGEPGEPVWPPERFGAWVAGRTGRDLTLTSSHDTKRAEDARARLLAMTHDPEAFEALLVASEGVPGAAEVPASLRWYIVQSLLAIWEEGRRDTAERLAAHVEKALREAREVTTWSHPRPEAEARAEEFSRALALDWAARRPPGLERLSALGARISLAQVALKCALPGIPDFYQGAEGPLHHLTDPDNRLAVDWEGLGEVGGPPAADAPLARRKGALARDLLRLRAEHPGLLASAARVEAGEGGRWTLLREGPAGRLAVEVDLASPRRRCGSSGGSAGPCRRPGPRATRATWRRSEGPRRPEASPAPEAGEVPTGAGGVAGRGGTQRAGAGWSWARPRASPAHPGPAPCRAPSPDPARSLRMTRPGPGDRRPGGDGPRICAVLLAGGRGGRLLDLTEREARPALFMGGRRRLVDYALQEVARAGLPAPWC